MPFVFNEFHKDNTAMKSTVLKNAVKSKVLFGGRFLFASPDYG